MSGKLLDPWIEGYLDYKRTVARLAPKSIVDQRSTLKRALETFGRIRPDTPLWKLTLEDYVSWVNQQRQAGYSAKSINKDLSHIRGLLNYAWRSGRSDRNVLDGFYLQDGAKNQMPKALSIDDARRLVEACPVSTALQRRNQLILLLLYGCGLRTSELCQLDVADIDLERQEVVVRKGKGDRSRRVPVPLAVWTPILAHLAERKGRRGALLRTQQKCVRLNSRAICVVVSDAAKAAGLEATVTPKTLRHSFATHLMDRGVDVAVIASLMGHRSAHETGVYLHRLPGRQEAAVKVISRKKKGDQP